MVHEHRFRAMGTNVEFLVRLAADEASWRVEAVMCRAQREVERLERLLSRFREESEISEINRRPGQWVSVSPETLDILRLASEMFLQTRGFFHPGLGHVLVAMGYGAGLRHEAPDVLGIAMTETGTNHFVASPEVPFRLDSENSRVWLEPGYQVDLGGIAKGWIVERAACVLVKEGVRSFVCNAGGDVVCRSEDDQPWIVGIADPFHPSSPLMCLNVHNLAVATSGTYVRRWRIGGREVHHLIDPFTGEPSTTDVISCTVIHERLEIAEVLAKVALLLGMETGIRWLSKQRVAGWVMVSEAGEVRMSCD